MKAKISIFFVWGFCFNIVASHHQYPGYRQGANQQHPNWSSNQNYAKNPSPPYSLRQPINYGPQQQVVKYVQSPPDPNYVQVYQEPKKYPQSAPEHKYSQLHHEASAFQEQNQESIYIKHQQEALSQKNKQQVVESQSDVIYNKPPTAPLLQVYPEGHPYLAIPDRTYESYGGPQPSPWQPAPPSSPVYIPDSYPSQVPKQWPLHNSYQPGPPIPQPASYPQWQSSGYKTISQDQYYGSPYDEQNAYNAPVKYTVQPQAQAAAAAPAALKSSDNNYQNFLALKPEVKKYLASASQKKGFILVHTNGTIEHVEAVDASLLDNSQFINLSDIIYHEDIQDDAPIKYHDNSVSNNMGSSPSPPLADNQNEKINPNETHKSNEFSPHSRQNFLKESNPDATPVNKDHSKNYYNPIYDKTNYGSHTEDRTIEPLPKPGDQNNYRHNTVYKTTPSQSHEIHVVEQNKTAQTPRVWQNNNSYKTPNEQQKSITDNIFTVNHSNDKSYDNNLRPNEENIKNYKKELFSYPSKINPESSDTSTTAEFVEYNKNRNSHESVLTNDKNNYYNPSEYSNNPFRPHDNYDDTTIHAEYIAKLATYATNTNPLGEATATVLPYYYHNPNNSDEINTNPSLETPKSSDNDSDIYDENQVPKKQSIDTSSKTQSYPEDVNPPKDKYNDDMVKNTTLVQQDSADYENTNEADGSDYEMESNTTDTQDTKCETISDDDDQQSNVESTTIYSSADDIRPLEKESTPNEDFLTDDTTNTGVEEEANQQEPTEKAKSENTADDNEVVVDFANFNQVSKPMFWFRPEEDFWDKLYSGNDNGGYDDLYVFNVKVVEPVIEKTSRTYVYENRTTLEEIEEIIWDNKSDTVPREIKVTKIIRNPGPEHTRPQKKKPDTVPVRKNNDTEVPKCKP